MTTQHAESGLLDEKPIKMDSTHGLNGNAGVNGHVSPDATQAESKSDNVPKVQDEQKGADPVVKQVKNQDAFAANQTLPEQLKEEAKEPDAAPDKSDLQAPAEAKVADENDKDGPTEGKTVVAEPLPDPTKEVTPEPKPATGATTESQPVQSPPVEDTASAVPPESATEAKEPSATESVSDLTPVPNAKEDVAMTDADVDAATAGPGADNAESTQETVMTDAPPVTPADETSIQAASSSNIAKDASQESPIQPTTADTSMSDAPPPSAKISRSRSPDDEDGPLAKRAKLDKAADEVEVKPKVEAKQEDQMDLDQDPNTFSLYLPNGEPKPLSDDSLNPHPITDYQSRQLRSILALVKKTKAGANFKLPVSEMWPALWTDYSAKIEQPIDISTMEKKLRGELPKYATMADFRADVERLVKNSVQFNGEVHEVTQFAKNTRAGIYSRMTQFTAAEPPKPEKKDSVKQHPTRHTEPRVTAQPAPAAAAPPKPPKPAAPTPQPAKSAESPAFAIPAGNNGMPIIRRDSTKGNDGRTKRPVKPAPNKDLVYDTKRKKKLSPELRFCEEVLTEIRKSKYFDVNGPFMQPVDPVALNIPSYHKIIKKPMDLGTMDQKLKAGEYLSLKEFDKDFDLIVKNCKTFNGEDHVITHVAYKLQDLYKAEMGKKDAWLSRHAPQTTTPSQSTTSPRPRDDDSDHDDADSGADDEADAEYRKAEQRIATLQKRLDEENKKISDIMNGGGLDFDAIEVSQSVVSMLQKQILAERAKLANMAPPSKKAAKPSKPSKPKKASGASGAAAGGNKKSGGSNAASSAKKTSAKKPKRKMGAVEKEVIAAGIADLEGHQLERAIEIIKQDTGQGENDSGELELDIEQLTEPALSKLYDLAIKNFPHLRAEKEKILITPAQAETPSAKPKPSAATKTKKNKPMSRSEQERRIQQLNDLRAQASRHGSGSQEPMESIEGNGRASVDPAPQPAQDSEDEESSEEE
ncbi:Bromodomain-containing factor 1 [Naviculisporaceae sp. PSN 640]